MFRKKYHVGKCVKCLTDKIIYNDETEREGILRRSYTCYWCGHKGKEIFKIKHIKTV